MIMKKILLLNFLLLLTATLSAQTVVPTQTDEIIIDNGNSVKADPGDRIRYKVTIENTGGMNGNGTQLSINPDPRTTFVPGSFRSSPLALPDAYTCTGNVGITVPAGNGLLANDFDDDMAGLTITAAAGATIQGGAFAIASDGGFSYQPPAGFTGTDEFTYTLEDGNEVPDCPPTDVGTVTITVSNLIWFVDNTGGGSGGDGRLNTPFKTLADFNANSTPVGDVTYIEHTGTNYNGGVILQNNEKLFGKGHTGGANLADVIGFSLAPFSNALPAINGSRPLVTNSSGDGVQLASDNTLRGFNVGNCSDFGIDDNGGVGTLSISELMITNTTGGGFRTDNGGTLAVTLGSLSSMGGTNGINLVNCAGSFSVNGGTINNASGTGAVVSGGSVVVSCLAAITDNSGLAVDINNHDSGNVTFSGNITSTGTGIRVQNCGGGTKLFSGSSKSLTTATNTAVTLSNNNGATINFTNGGLAIMTTSGTGFNATGGGTITVQGSANTITSTTSHGVYISDTNIGANDVTFASVSTNGIGGSNTGGIFLKNTGTVAGSSFVVNGGTIQNAKGDDLVANAMSTTGNGIGVYLQGVQNVTLNGLTVTNSDNFGIRGFGVSGTTTLTNVTVNGAHGTNIISDEASVTFNELTGTVNVTGGNYGGGLEDNFAIANTSGTINANFSAVTFSPNSTTTGDNGLQIRTSEGAPGNFTTGNVNINNCIFNGARSVMLFVDIAGNGGGTVNVGGTSGNTFTQNQPNLPSGGAIEVLASGTGNTSTMTSTISNNTILAGSDTFSGDVVISGTGFGYAGTHNLTITNNRIGTSGVNGSAVNPASGQGDSGIVVTANGTGTLNARLHSNNVFDFNAAGIEIFFDAEGPSSPTGGNVNLNVTDNIVSDALGGANASISFIGSHAVNVCANISGNKLENPMDREIEIDVLGTPGGFYRVPGLGTQTEAGVEALYLSNNTTPSLVPLVAADVKVFAMTPNYTITSSGGCTMP